MSLESALRLGVVAAFILLIESLCRLHVIPVNVMPPPSAMATSLYDILLSGEFTGDILSSMRNIALSALIAVLLGFVAGAVIHAMPAFRAALEPFLASYYAVPTFMFYPVFIILFGVGDRAIIAISVLLAVVAMMTATLNGLDRIPNVLRKTGHMFRMSPVKAALLIHLPAAAPYIFTGVKLAVAYAFIGVIASEFILSGSGLGYAIGYAYNNFNNQTMYALMLLVLVLVVLVNGTLDAIDRHLRERRQR